MSLLTNAITLLRLREPRPAPSEPAAAARSSSSQLCNPSTTHRTLQMGLSQPSQSLSKLTVRLMGVLTSAKRCLRARTASCSKNWPRSDRSSSSSPRCSLITAGPTVAAPSTMTTGPWSRIAHPRPVNRSSRTKSRSCVNS